MGGIFMQIPVFWRLILGTLGILLLSIAACLYSIIQLGTLSRTARAALDGDHRMIRYQEALTDAFLSEVRYGGKYIITHAEDRHEQLRQFKNDFARFLGELKSLVQSEEVANSLSRVEKLHRQYHELFDRETGYIRAKQTYAQSRYQQERDKVFESALSELERLKTMLQANLQEKLEGIDHAARTARQIAIITTLIVALLGILFSVKLSKSLVAPLKQQLRIETEPHTRSWVERVAASRHSKTVQRERAERTTIRRPFTKAIIETIKYARK
jgi:CHASE3 domain sensor protein